LRMRHSAAPLALALIVLAGCALVFLKRCSNATPPSPERPARASGPIPAPGSPPPPAPEARVREGPRLGTTLEAALRGEPLVPAPGVPSGPLTAEASGGDPVGAPDLGLTDSQRVLIEALLARRAAGLEELRKSAAGGPLSKEEALLLADRANAVHLSCLAEIRSSLLPDQREKFDAVVGSGAWGRYSFVIPVR
jgi:hypothetical protein